MTKELQEQLKTVAEYNGLHAFTSSYGGSGLCKDEKDMSTWIEIGDLQYHSSWDAQIPVWSKALKEFANMKISTTALMELLDKKSFQTQYFNAVNHNSPTDGFKVLVELIQLINKYKEK